MQWWLNNGHKIEDLKKLAASGKRIKTLEQIPKVFRDLGFIWQAFVDLSSSRQIGLDENPILISEMEAWLNIHGVQDIELRIEFFRLIKTLDNTRIDWLRKREWQKKKQV